MKRQQRVQRPAMVRDCRRPGRRRLLCRGQTRMRRAQVIAGADQAPPLLPGQGLACQRPASTRPRRAAFPQGRLEPLQVGRIAHTGPLRSTSACLHACRRASDQAACRRAPPASLRALDDVGDEDRAPGTQAWSAALARLHGLAQGLPHGPEVGHQASGTAHQGATCRPAPHPLEPPPAQRQITRRADLTAEPPARLAHQRQRPPHHAPCFLPRRASACPWPTARGGATRSACPACPWRPERAHHTATVRSSNPKAATSAGTGHP